MNNIILVDVQAIAYWPDDSWCPLSEADSYMRSMGKSDDFGIIHCPDSYNDDTIDFIVSNANR